MSTDVDFNQRMQRVEELIREVESSPDAALRARAVELVSILMELHGAGLKQLLELLAKTGAAGNAAIERFGRDPLVSSLLLLYGLHPVPLEVRIGHALEKVRPLLRSHGGNVEVIGIEDGNVRLRLEGSCHGCPSSAQTLKNAIYEAIYEFAPDLADLQVEGVTATPEPPAGFVPLEQVVAL